MNLTKRTELHRMPHRGSRDIGLVYSILDAEFLAHVGFEIDGQPFVIPTLYGREQQKLFLHGSSASRMLRRLEAGCLACVTVTLVDGLVLARSAFNHSMNYRSVVVFGTARKIEDSDRKVQALYTISEHVLPGRWAEIRSPNPREMKATTVLEFAIEEASAKIREGDPIDDEEDYSLPVWAGIVPLRMETKAPIPDPRLPLDVEAPHYILESRFRRQPFSQT
jgi:uncharacterized protein